MYIGHQKAFPAVFVIKGDTESIHVVDREICVHERPHEKDVDFKRSTDLEIQRVIAVKKMCEHLGITPGEARILLLSGKENLEDYLTEDLIRERTRLLSIQEASILSTAVIILKYRLLYPLIFVDAVAKGKTSAIVQRPYFDLNNLITETPTFRSKDFGRIKVNSFVDDPDLEHLKIEIEKTTRDIPANTVFYAAENNGFIRVGDLDVTESDLELKMPISLLVGIHNYYGSCMEKFKDEGKQSGQDTKVSGESQIESESLTSMTLMEDLSSFTNTETESQ